MKAIMGNAKRLTKPLIILQKKKKTKPVKK